MKYNRIISETATLLSGSVVAQAITLVAYFLLLHIYTPADYGLFSIFYSYIEVIIIVSTCKYELAVVADRSDRGAAAIARFALRLNTIVSLSLLAILTVLTLTGMLPGKFARLGGLALLIAPMVFFCGTTRVYSSLYNRLHRYRVIASSDIVCSASGATLKTVFGLLGMHSSGMPLGTVLGQAAANIGYRLKLSSLNLPKTTREEQREASRRHRNYPLYTAPKDLINSLSANLPFLWLALYFDNAAVGLFGLAMTFIIQPCQLICASFERVLYAHCAEAIQNGRPLMRPLLRFLLPASGAALAVATALWFFAEPLFGILFGGKWAGCGVYVRALLPWAVVNIGSLSLMFIPNLFSTQRTELFINIGRLILRAAAIGVGIAAVDFKLAVNLFSAASTIVAIILLTWYLFQANRHDKTLETIS